MNKRVRPGTDALIWLPIDGVLIHSNELPPARFSGTHRWAASGYRPEDPRVVPLLERAWRGNILVHEEQQNRRISCLKGTWRGLCRERGIPFVRCAVGGETPYGRRLWLEWDTDTVELPPPWGQGRDKYKEEGKSEAHARAQCAGMRGLPPAVKRYIENGPQMLVLSDNPMSGCLDALEGVCTSFALLLNWLNRWNLGPDAPEQSWEEWEQVKAERARV